MANSVKENAGVAGENFGVLQKLIYKHQIVYQKKITFSIACFLLFFIGAPLGAIIRKGGLGMPAIVSTLFFILYWIISFIGEKYAAEGVLPVWQGMWIASLILLPIGIFLTRKQRMTLHFWMLTAGSSSSRNTSAFKQNRDYEDPFPLQ